MPRQSDEPKEASQGGDPLGERQEELNESVATGEDGVDGEIAIMDSFPAGDPPATY
ncbi:MAG: hypothetical protein M3Y91_08090 [Actinomycetota bacterium]|nr:hypothetical protein [Actinomycetota bacterium]